MKNNSLGSLGFSLGSLGSLGSVVLNYIILNTLEKQSKKPIFISLGSLGSLGSAVLNIYTYIKTQVNCAKDYKRIKQKILI